MKEVNAAMQIELSTHSNKVMFIVGGNGYRNIFDVTHHILENKAKQHKGFVAVCHDNYYSSLSLITPHDKDSNKCEYVFISEEDVDVREIRYILNDKYRNVAYLKEDIARVEHTMYCS